MPVRGGTREGFCQRDLGKGFWQSLVTGTAWWPKAERRLCRRARRLLSEYGWGQDEKMREQCLKLTLACLSYDFFGTSSDETTEDVGTVQVCVIFTPPCCRAEHFALALCATLSTECARFHARFHAGQTPQSACARIVWTLVTRLRVCAGAHELALVDRGPKHNGDVAAGLQHVSCAALGAGDGVPVAAGLCASVAVSQPGDAASVPAPSVDGRRDCAARAAAAGRGGEFP
jgi:hypothetical protein